ncbi:MAG: alpha/beta hydrolase [Paracoccaceae bacterium]
MSEAPQRRPAAGAGLRTAIRRFFPKATPPQAVNFLLRRTAKRMLAELQEPRLLREALEADAEHLFRLPPRARFAEASIPRRGGAMPALWATSGDGPAPDAAPGEAPVILYLHGGAYIAGSPRTHRHLAAALAGAIGGQALVPDYRLAPEHRLPAALSDARAAWDWLVRRGHRPGRIVVMGDSAGGGLAFALLADLTADRERLPGALVVFSPWVDLSGTAGSLARNAEAEAMLPAGRFEDLIGFCLGEGGPARDDWRVSPLNARFRAPPPAMIFAGMTEILLDDAIAIAEAMRRAGGDPELELRQALPHAWPVFLGYMREADETVEKAGRFVRRVLKG